MRTIGFTDQHHSSVFSATLHARYDSSFSAICRVDLPRTIVFGLDECGNRQGERKCEPRSEERRHSTTSREALASFTKIGRSRDKRQGNIEKGSKSGEVDDCSVLAMDDHSTLTTPKQLRVNTKCTFSRRVSVQPSKKKVVNVASPVWGMDFVMTSEDANSNISTAFEEDEGFKKIKEVGRPIE